VIKKNGINFSSFFSFFPEKKRNKKKETREIDFLRHIHTSPFEKKTSFKMLLICQTLSKIILIFK